MQHAHCPNLPVLCRLQRDQAAHAHASSKQVGDELVAAQAEATEQAARLGREADRRRHAESLLEEGLQVQNQILLGLQVSATLLFCTIIVKRLCVC